MSGQQIGTVVGGIIGAYFGMPTLGMAIGGFIGGLVDPTKVNGPHIGDGQTQTSTEGSAISWVHGTGWVAGTIVQVSPVREKKIHDSGKGGPSVSHYEAHQDFAILVCESDETRGSTISGVLAVEADGKIVYDVRDGSAIISDSAKWVANVDFLFGAEDQLPHATLEAISGVGNTCAYRGSFVAVFKDWNISAAGNRIPSFRFLVSGSGLFLFNAGQTWRYLNIARSDNTNYYTEAYDDSSWNEGPAPFGNIAGAPGSGIGAHQFDSRLSATVATQIPLNTGVAMRKVVYIGAVPPGGFTLKGWLDNFASLYVNGVNVVNLSVATAQSVTYTVAAHYFRSGKNLIAVRFTDDATTGGAAASYWDFSLDPIGAVGPEAPIDLSVIVAKVCERGGLTTDDIDVSALSGTAVAGFPISKQMNAADCLTPLLNGYFAYGSEYNALVNFKFYGDDADVTIDVADLIEGNDANDGAITSNLRAQETEFPKTFIGRYYDPAQNYMAVTVRRSRNATSVNAIGQQQIDIPVAMAADVAIQAVDKAMKVAYARLEGTLEYSVPFAGTDAYITLCAGEPLLLNGKRYVLNGATISNGYLHFKTAYDRQSAYTSNVQAVLGLPPATPTTPYSGPTLLYAMNLPSLRPQDTYGIYLAASSTTGSPNWRGCTMEVSLDGEQSWQSLPDIVQASTMGTLTANMPPTGPISVQVNGDLESVTDAQIAAGMNAAAIITSADIAEVIQFKTATLVTGQNYTLTNFTRGEAGTPTPTHVNGERFTMLDSVYFYALDVAMSGKTIYFRATGYGETTASATVISLVYKPNTDVVINGGVVTT